MTQEDEGVAPRTWWQRTAKQLARRHPGFPLAGEVAQRIADHHAAQLPLGWESVPVMDEGDDE